MNKYTIIIIILIILTISTFTYYIFNFLATGDYPLNPTYAIQYGINQLKLYFQEFITTKEEIAKTIPSDFIKVYPHMGLTQAQRSTYPFTGSAVIDIDNSNKDLIFVGGGEGQHDGLLSYKNGKLINIIYNTNLSDKDAATYCAASIDLNNNGYMDLVIGRSNGVFVYTNNKDNTFTKTKIYQPNDRAVIAISIGDYNKNKKPDIYLSMFTPPQKLLAFQFNNNKHYRKNVMLQNNSTKYALKFDDVTEETNAYGNQNTFTSAFVDFGSGRPDLVLAHDTGKVEILKNTGSKFESINLETPYGFWMGIAVGDYNNNGNLDLFFTNVGNTLPLSDTGGIRGNPSKGGLKEGQILTNNHLFLRNDGNYKFTSIQPQEIINSGFAWGSQFEDINLNGNLDLIYAQNYIDVPAGTYLSGMTLLNKDNNFIKTTKYPNNNYGHTPLFADLTGTGTKDLIWINMVGDIFGYELKQTNNFVSIKIPNNIEFANATITLTQGLNKQIRQNVVGGVGFGSGNGGYHAVFGLNKTNIIDSITIKTIYGEEIIIEKPEVNKQYIITYDKKISIHE